MSTTPCPDNELSPARLRALVVTPVGFGPRLVASLIDGLLFAIVSLPLVVSVYGFAYLHVPSTNGGGGINGLLINHALPMVMVVGFWIWRGATPGKMLVGARIVDATTYRRPHPGRLLLRYVAYFVSLLPAGLGFLWIAFDQRAQGWHDKLAGTVVIAPYE